MTTFHKTKLNCPCCDDEVEASRVISTNTFGGKTTDFHQYASGFQPLSLHISTCPSCGYSGYYSDYENVEVDSEVKNLIRQRITPLIRDEKASSGRGYEYAAWIAKWRQRSSLEIGELYLRAAWCCYDSGEKEEELHYRRQAIEHFEIALRKNEIQKENIAVYTYLIGEIYRRIEEKEYAKMWFEKVPEIIGKEPDSEKQWLIELSIQQKTNPKEYFDSR